MHRMRHRNQRDGAKLELKWEQKIKQLSFDQQHLEHPGSGTVHFGTTRLDTAVRLLLIHEYVLVLQQSYFRVNGNRVSQVVNTRTNS